MPLPAHIEHEIYQHLEEIQRLFKASKITLVCRAVGFPDGSRDLICGDDDLESAIAAIRTQQQLHAKGGAA